MKLIILLLLFSTNVLAAEVVELPEEELARESVLPKFENTVMVRNRNVVTEGRLDLGVLYSYAMTESIYSINRLGVNLFYHTSEDHAFGLVYFKQLSGLSTYADQLDHQYGLKFARAPAPDSTLFGEYNLKFYYGKMSVAKNSTLSLSLYLSGGGGFIKYIHKSYPLFSLGLGQKFYLSQSWALRFDMRMLMHNAPIPYLQGRLTTGSQLPEYNDFADRMYFNAALDVGLTHLF